MSKRLFLLLLLGLMVVQARAFCFAQAGTEYGIDPLLLEAIAVHESRLNPDTVVRNSNNTLDIGLMGINTVHLSDKTLIQAGYSAQILLDPCTNVRVGAWLLRRKISKWGETWKAVGAYHSETPERNGNYQWLIYRSYESLKRKILKASSDG